ncbi:MAG: hypothetical protein A2V70_01245 [Planctomycetes bacterium RBG_13_63_9]|nr:MAG: hypothetical protein A2V70_01245 [Planctomycetes bacterium RBG_13_63_9]
MSSMLPAEISAIEVLRFSTCLRKPSFMTFALKMAADVAFCNVSCSAAADVAPGLRPSTLKGITATSPPSASYACTWNACRPFGSSSDTIAAVVAMQSDSFSVPMGHVP